MLSPPYFLWPHSLLARLNLQVFLVSSFWWFGSLPTLSSLPSKMQQFSFSLWRFTGETHLPREFFLSSFFLFLLSSFSLPSYVSCVCVPYFSFLYPLLFFILFAKPTPCVGLYLHPSFASFSPPLFFSHLQPSFFQLPKFSSSLSLAALLQTLTLD